MNGSHFSHASVLFLFGSYVALNVLVAKAWKAKAKALRLDDSGGYIVLMLDLHCLLWIANHEAWHEAMIEEQWRLCGQEAILMKSCRLQSLEPCESWVLVSRACMRLAIVSLVIGRWIRQQLMASDPDGRTLTGSRTLGRMWTKAMWAPRIWLPPRAKPVVVVRPPQGICLLGRSPVVPWGGEDINIYWTFTGRICLLGREPPPSPVVRTPTPHPASCLRHRGSLASNFLSIRLGHDSMVDDGIFTHRLIIFIIIVPSLCCYLSRMPLRSHANGALPMHHHHDGRDDSRGRARARGWQGMGGVEDGVQLASGIGFLQ